MPHRRWGITIKSDTYLMYENIINKKQLLDLTHSLISYKSITPHQAGCIDFLQSYLKQAGFQTVRVDREKTSNLIATYGDLTQPILAFAGHIDVVPPGDSSKWKYDPFSLTEDDGILYGRGISDMKGAVASFVLASIEYIKKTTTTQPKYAIMLLITSDEEGAASDGTIAMVDYLISKNIRLNYCLIGEPTAEVSVGDVVKIGRRGSLIGDLEIFGKQGHVAYPHLCDNPIHKFAGALNELVARQWDNGSDFFPPSTFQITNLNAGVGVSNVIPGNLVANFNFRYNDLHSVDELKEIVTGIFDSHQLQYNIGWRNSAVPFLTQMGRLIKVVDDSVYSVSGVHPQLKTDGGTSDGRFLIAVADEILELGLSNQHAHKINEAIVAAELPKLAQIYYTILVKIFND